MRDCYALSYVGETGYTLYQRQLLNISLIRRQKPDQVALHFNSDKHFESVPLEKKTIWETMRAETLWKKLG